MLRLHNALLGKPGPGYCVRQEVAPGVLIHSFALYVLQGNREVFIRCKTDLHNHLSPVIL